MFDLNSGSKSHEHGNFYLKFGLLFYWNIKILRKNEITMESKDWKIKILALEILFKMLEILWKKLAKLTNFLKNQSKDAKLVKEKNHENLLKCENSGRFYEIFDWLDDFFERFYNIFSNFWKNVDYLNNIFYNFHDFFHSQ